MRVLVAEDDPGLRDVLVIGLEDQGYQVDAVERGDEAIDQLRWYEYDVAVIDWRMPGAEGIDVIALARRNNRPTAAFCRCVQDGCRNLSIRLPAAVPLMDRQPRLLQVATAQS